MIPCEDFGEIAFDEEKTTTINVVDESGTEWTICWSMFLFLINISKLVQNCCWLYYQKWLILDVLSIILLFNYNHIIMLDAFCVICCVLHHHFCMNFKLELDVHCQKDKRQFFANERQRKKEAIFFFIVYLMFF
jgi:hypothetical protein